MKILAQRNIGQIYNVKHGRQPGTWLPVTHYTCNPCRTITGLEIQMYAILNHVTLSMFHFILN